MKVYELITMLQRVPRDLEVVVDYDGVLMRVVAAQVNELSKDIYSRSDKFGESSKVYQLIYEGY